MAATVMPVDAPRRQVKRVRNFMRSVTRRSVNGGGAAAAATRGIRERALPWCAAWLIGSPE
jgi:hypothetical protein